MGKWRLRCPRGGEYEGDCQYFIDEKGRFILVCKSKLKKLKEPKDGGCGDLIIEH
jgi:hypothetical protein